MPDRLKAGLEALSGFDMSDVRVRFNSNRPAQMNALAAAQGTRIDIGPGQEQHLPHEAWHVVQQKQGRVRPMARAKGLSFNDDTGLEHEADVMGTRALRGASVTPELEREALDASSLPVQRRIPAIVELEQLVETWTLGNTGTDTAPKWGVVPVTPADAAVHLAGLRRVLQTQIRDIRMSEGNVDTGPMMTAIRFAQPIGTTVDETVAKGDAQQLLFLARNVLKNEHTLLRPPEGYMAPPASVTEQTNLRTLVDEAVKVFDLVAGGTKDSVLSDIFGASNVKDARDKVGNGKTALLKLFNDNKLLTDRSGYSSEVGLGGMSAFGINVLLPAAAIDNPTGGHSIATTFHEAMHAGNSDVKDDGGYVGSPGFKERAEPLKLVNAAHYEVIALRHLVGSDAKWDGQFVPPGTVSGGSSGKTPEPTQTEKALNRVSEMFRRSWTAALWLHDDMLNVYKSPDVWGTIKVGTFTYAQWLTYWSGVLGLTIGLRHATIDPVAPEKARKPVTQIDMSLIETITKRFAQLGAQMPKTQTDALKFNAVYPDGTNWDYVFDMPAEAKALAKYLLGLANVVGSPDQDLLAVDALCSFYANVHGSPLPDQHVPTDMPK